MQQNVQQALSLASNDDAPVANLELSFNGQAAARGEKVDKNGTHTLFLSLALAISPLLPSHITDISIL